ncbi:Uncharacterised protein [Shigella sonnei]|nr:Uncharacterised protein [Shigella sonnei]
MASKKFYSDDDIQLAKAALSELPDLTAQRKTLRDFLDAIRDDIIVLVRTKGYTLADVAKWHLNRSQFGIRIDHDLAFISDHSLASQSITIWHASDH